MAFRFVLARLRSPQVRRLSLVLVVAIALVLGWAAKSFSDDGTGTVIIYTRGMMQPEMITVPGPNGRIKYTVTSVGNMFLVKANGRAFVGLSDNGKQLLISDPNGAKNRVIIKASVSGR